MSPAHGPTMQRLAQGSDQAPVVLAVHSLGMNGACWRSVAKDSGATFFAFDQLGHGARATEVPQGFDALVADAQTALDRLPHGPVHLVGHSLGGCVAASLAAQEDNRARIASLTLVASPLRGMPQFTDRATAVADGGMAQVSQQTLERWFGPDGQAEAAAAWQEAHACLHAMTPAGFDAAWHALSEFVGVAGLPKITAPTLGCSFPLDLSTPPPVGMAITEALVERGTIATHCTLSGGGHMGVLTHAAELATLLQAHWQSARETPPQEPAT